MILAGIAVCWFWYRLLRTYQTLLDFRFEQLETMERSEAMQGCHGMYPGLPSRAGNLEAERFYRKAPPERQIGFSRIEMRLPLLFIGLYVLMGVGTAVATGLVVTGALPTPVLMP